MTEVFTKEKFEKMYSRVLEDKGFFDVNAVIHQDGVNIYCSSSIAPELNGMLTSVRKHKTDAQIKEVKITPNGPKVVTSIFFELQNKAVLHRFNQLMSVFFSLAKID